MIGRRADVLLLAGADGRDDDLVATDLDIVDLAACRRTDFLRICLDRLGIAVDGIRVALRDARCLGYRVPGDRDRQLPLPRPHTISCLSDQTTAGAQTGR